MPTLLNSNRSARRRPELVAAGILCLVMALSIYFQPDEAMAEIAGSRFHNESESGYVLTGRLVDAETRESLPAANIQLKDTFRGSITNNRGFFEIRVPELPATLVFRYIGYETQEVEFTLESTDKIVELMPSSVELEELVFTGEDPAIHIMERVIARKQIWRAELESWKADAYTRQSLSNDQEIVTITESLSETWWQRGRGFREFIVDQRQTNNVLADQNFAGTSYLPNFYDDEIEVAGFRVIGVTHPNAFRYYDFRIEDRRSLDDQTVYDIRVIPRTRLQPVFEGMISVLGEEYALIEVDLVPGEMIFFPPPVQDVNLSYQQQFSNYGGSFWLPTDVRISGVLEIGIPGFRIPEIRFNLVSSITNYEINLAVPDSVFGRQAFISRLDDTQRERIGRSFEIQSEFIPLSEEEQEAYDTIDSTRSIQDAFQPTGFLARLAGDGSVQVGADGSSSSISNRFSLNPDLRYNRVETVYGGIKPELIINRDLRVSGKIGYGTGQEEWSFGGRLNMWVPGTQRRLSLGLSYDYDTALRIESQNFIPLMSSVNMLAGFDDYFDYYNREQFRAEAIYRIPSRVLGIRLEPGVSFYAETHRSLEKTTNYSIRGGVTQRDNPAVDDGSLNALAFSLRLGDTPAPFGVAGSTGAIIKAEHASDAFGSDFGFTRYEAMVDVRINTFLQRRLLSNTLDIRMQGFTHTGELPVQMFGGFDGRHTLFTPFGGFKTAFNRMPEGEHGVAMFLEHNFRTIPFELLGLMGVARSGLGLIVHGASGRTWIDNDRLQNMSFTPFYDDGWRHEAGVSLNSIFGIIRLDTAWRLDQPGFYIGISAARFF